MHQSEFHHCPCCQRRTRHRVSSERKLAPVLWCQSCFHVQVVAELETPAFAALTKAPAATPIRLA